MKKIKKIFAALLAMTMVLGMGVTTFATGETPPQTPNPSTVIKTNDVNGTNTDTGIIKVLGIEDESAKNASFAVYAFPIVKAVYAAEADGGKFKSEYESLYTNLQLAENTFNQDADDLPEKLAAIKAGFVYNETDSKWTNQLLKAADKTTTVYQMTKDTDGGYKAEVPVGSYLVVVRNADAKFYTPIVVSASYTATSTGASGIEENTLSISGDVAWVKIGSKPELTKTATTPNGTILADNTSTADKTNMDAQSVNVGDVVEYKVEVDKIPNYDGDHPVFKITDTLSDGLDFYFEKVNNDDTFEKSIVVKAGDTTLTYDTDYKVTVDSTNARKVTINFVKQVDSKDVYTLKAYPEQKLTITYKAKVNSSAEMNGGDNYNTVKLNYSKDSNIDSNDGDGDDEIEKKTYNYTFDLSTNVNGSSTTSIVNKVGQVEKSDTKTEALAGAVFGLYTDQACEHLYTASTLMPDGTVTSADGTNGTTKGALIIRGLAAGTYYLKEKVAPAGYSLSEKVFKIEIKATYFGASDTEVTSGTKEVGQLKSWHVNITDIKMQNPTTSNNGKLETGEISVTGNNTVTANFEIKNTQLSALPSTGGIGTTIFTIGGCAIMILAAGLYFASRRRSAK